jgi:hypothetical protein
MWRSSSTGCGFRDRVVFDQPVQDAAAMQALSVARTRDGGRSFERLRDGLPQRNCFDLVCRHGLAGSR